MGKSTVQGDEMLGSGADGGWNFGVSLGCNSLLRAALGLYGELMGRLLFLG